MSIVSTYICVVRVYDVYDVCVSKMQAYSPISLSIRDDLIPVLPVHG